MLFGTKKATTTEKQQKTTDGYLWYGCVDLIIYLYYL